MGFSQKITDAMNNYSRSVTRQQMDEAPPELKYVYIGPVDEKTRPFCLEAAGAGPLTLDEINSLGGEWVESLSSGGGINCRHNLELASSDIKSQFHNGDEALKVLEGKLKRKEIAKWKPSMTKEVAKKFVKQSTIKDTIYHGTTVSASESIAKNGFSLQQTTTPDNNIGIGYEALKANTTGTENAAGGGYALYANTTGSYNTAFGYASLSTITTASNLSAFGYRALGANTSGSSNNAFGYNSLRLNTTGN